MINKSLGMICHTARHRSQARLFHGTSSTSRRKSGDKLLSRTAVQYYAIGTTPTGTSVPKVLITQHNHIVP